MKIALVHDFLGGIGGSERIFQHICEEFQEADIYTLAYNPKATLPYFSTRKIHTTWMNPLIRSSETFRWAFPIATHVMQHIDLSHYDLVLSSSATTAKYVRTSPGNHLCYCYIPTRALWHTDAYFGESFKRYLISPFLKALRTRDFYNAQKITQFIAISKISKNYIHKYYNRDAEVIYCPVETNKFIPSQKKGNHYLLVSRLETWKKIDYAIEAFNRLKKPLKIIGTGTEKARLQRISKSNISFMGSLNDTQLAREYSECKAVIFTPSLEYGLIPLEANASGTPVVCYGYGGVEETMIPFGHPIKKPTAIFFYEQTAEALIAAVEQFEKVQFDLSSLVQHASNWDVASFKRKMRSFVRNFKALSFEQ